MEQSAKQTNDAIAQLTERMAALAKKVEQPPVLPRTFGPEKDLKEFLKGMKNGEMRGGLGVRDLLDPLGGGFEPNDIIQINEQLEDSALRTKVAAFRKVLNSSVDDPLVGKILQLIGPTKQRLGPRKYKVHVDGIGKDGFLENELILLQRAN